MSARTGVEAVAHGVSRSESPSWNRTNPSSRSRNICRWFTLASVALTRGGELLLQPRPYPAGTATTRTVWHRRNDHDAAHVWLRERSGGGGDGS